MAFFRCNDHTAMDNDDKLRQVRYLIDNVEQSCQDYFQCNKEVAVDERMVRSKHRSGMRQYNKDKPTKWGLKLWVLADSDTGYTYNFNVYLGKTRRRTSGKGLGYDVVMDLTECLRQQGYHVYTDNFYTFPPLLKDLKQEGLLGCGTTSANRKHFPKEMKTSATWAKKVNRGKQRWQRFDGDVLGIQWKDNKVVSMLSTIHKGSDSVWCRRRCKDPRTGRFSIKVLKQPKAIQDYNRKMKGVDQSDQLIRSYSVLRKVKKYWKILFFHLIDVSIVNAFVLWKEYRSRARNCD